VVTGSQSSASTPSASVPSLRRTRIAKAIDQRIRGDAGNAGYRAPSCMPPTRRSRM
jgi:hypothetical protein